MTQIGIFGFKICHLATLGGREKASLRLLFETAARCRYQQQPAQDYSEVVFECPPPGILGNTVSVQSFADRIYVLEIQVLGGCHRSLSATGRGMSQSKKNSIVCKARQAQSFVII
jgi:hypothetical protein